MQFDASLVGPALRDTVGHLRANPRVFGSIFLASTVAGLGFDLSAALGEAAILYAFAFTFFNLFLQACTIIGVLQSGGQAVSPRDWRIASLFGVGLIASLGIALGLLVLVLPGLFVAGRWFLAAPILFAEDCAVSEALHASWARTEQYWLTCTIIAVGAFLCQAAPLIASMYLLPDGEPARTAMLIVTNALSQAAWMFSIAAAATLYLTIGRPSVRHSEIFG